ncbi:UV DNA damage repair endonuclease UvsE [Ornithinibacillus halophilus]|uniref:UV-damage endonuclease n=1 Tax=Ornithinibacillus halophilus TaxID=930117 RepID=A0A1M5FKR4_9BACI|nr:UV DNA damage repair endonuclease UvsE [Ornithinibacillus halophilus]SHF92019.1 UV-damage endonuclease [Ornithinibacillus halophilus]
MTIIRLGYSAISTHVKNSSTSKTMTYSTFSKLTDREAAIRKLEKIANSNLANVHRLFKHNVAHDIQFYRISSKLIPLADHPDIEKWNYMRPLQESLTQLKSFLDEHPDYRVDFHADHFVLINSPDKEVLKTSIKTLRMHYRLLKGMGIEPIHRCVMHVGGGYNDKEQALEQFIQNWAYVPQDLQQMIILENDDKTFDLHDTLYLCEKLDIPLVFDYHHHLANHSKDNWAEDWDRVVQTWEHSKLPVKMHISSPKSENQFRSHADYVDVEMFLNFLRAVKGSVNQIDCMIEAKQKDDALFKLMEDIKENRDIKILDGGSFKIL